MFIHNVDFWLFVVIGLKSLLLFIFVALESSIISVVNEYGLETIILKMEYPRIISGGDVWASLNFDLL